MTAVVTGAASGIGRGIARAVAQRGMNVALAEFLDAVRARHRRIEAAFGGGEVQAGL